jgi:hypothetical protein
MMMHIGTDRDHPMYQLYWQWSISIIIDQLPEQPAINTLGSNHVTMVRSTILLSIGDVIHWRMRPQLVQIPLVLWRSVLQSLTITKTTRTQTESDRHRSLTSDLYFLAACSPYIGGFKVYTWSAISTKSRCDTGLMWTMSTSLVPPCRPGLRFLPLESY